MKTLIVDDEPLNCEVLRSIIKPFSTYEIAENGVKALELFQAALTAGCPFDLVLLDIMMPEMDGQQTLKEIRAIEDAAFKGDPDHKRVYVVMVTCLDDPENFLQAQGSGIEWYINKPVNRAKLLALFRELNLLPRETAT